MTDRGHSKAWAEPRAALLCLVLSLLVHGALAAMILLLPEGEGKAAEPRAGKVRMVQVVRLKAAEKPDEAEKKQQEETREKNFAKTSADAPQQRPERADFEGARNARAMSDPTARDRRSEEEAPAQHGRERTEEEEIVTFDQERQDGDLAYEGKEQTPPAPPEPPAEEGEGEDAQEIPPAAPRPAMLTAQPFREDALGEFALRDTEPEETETPNEPLPPRRAARRRYYDPALSAEAQRPGFRTEERRTRSSGRFIFGKGAALNVAATPRGQYEAEIYRRVARLWYAACDDHRGDIIPGRLTISLRLDRHGRLVNMHLMSRSGASVSQQSFTFAAIRRAALPAMPAAVQGEMVGDLLELIFTFHFD